MKSNAWASEKKLAAPMRTAKNGPINGEVAIAPLAG
jgi:hypothetical protein